MIVLVSDLHLSDETTANNVRPAAFDLLSDKIEEASKKADDIHIVLLGDIFDLGRTDYWNRNNIEYDKRPWNGELDPQTGMNKDTRSVCTQYCSILGDIIKTPSAVSLIRNLNNGIEEKTGKKPKITYVIGNHDQPFNNIAGLKTRIENEIQGIEFANKIIDADYNLAARHGHEWDENCYGLKFFNEVLTDGKSTLMRFDPGAYRVSSIGEVITAELMSGLIYRFGEKMKENGFVADDDKKFFSRLKDVNNLRPLMAVFHWLDWFTGDKEEKYLDLIKMSLCQSIEAVLNSKLGKAWDGLARPVFKPFGGDITDWLEFGLSYLKPGDINFFKKLADLYLKYIANSIQDDRYQKGAELEWTEKEEWKNEIREGNIQYIVYGHTHYAKYKYVDLQHNGKEHLYVNAGTFLPLIEMVGQKGGFAQSTQMTMVYVYNTEESEKSSIGTGPTLDFWRGIRK